MEGIEDILDAGKQEGMDFEAQPELFVFFVKHNSDVAWTKIVAVSVDDAATQYANTTLPNGEGWTLSVFRAADKISAQRTVAVKSEWVRQVEVRP